MLWLSDWLSREQSVQERGCLDRAAQDKADKLLFAPAAVGAIDDFIETALDVLGADTVEATAKPGLETADHWSHPGSADSKSLSRSEP
jgi:hypothetical protein